MAQGNLSACLPVILGYEGGFTRNPKDPGNWTGGKIGEGVLKGTNFGIAASAHPTLDIEHLTKETVTPIYQSEYWEPAGCEALAPGLDLCHFDGTVNSGRGNSARWLAKSGGSIHAYCAARLTSMHSFGAWATFGKGWAARVSGVEAKAISMAAGSPTMAATIMRKVGAQAATKAKTSSALAHAATAVVSGGAALSPSHPAIGLTASALALVTAVLSHFHASTAGARAAVLANAAASA